jgi:copper resistance protein B
MTRLPPIAQAFVIAALPLSSAIAATHDMQGMDHSQMTGMDHSQMQHG